MKEEKKRVLFICGSMNQTTQMHKIAREMEDFDIFFTPHFCDGALEILRKVNLLEFTILGNRHIKRCLDYLASHTLNVDFQGKNGPYDLVVTCSDLVVPQKIRESPIVLVQEGMTDPENWLYHLVRRYRFLPRWFSHTAAMGLSNIYEKFCVASEGYKELFARKGADLQRMVVTGIPNFDDCRKFLDNTFPHRGYVLVCTSDIRETYKYENRKRFILRATEIAAGRPLFFKLHPNENVKRAAEEVRRYAPGAKVFSHGNTEEMIANCDALITRYSSTVYVGLALGKEVYSDFDVEELRSLTPLQNGSAAKNIAEVCRTVLSERTQSRPVRSSGPRKSRLRRYSEVLFPGILP